MYQKSSVSDVNTSSVSHPQTQSHVKRTNFNSIVSCLPSKCHRQCSPISNWNQVHRMNAHCRSKQTDSSVSSCSSSNWFENSIDLCSHKSSLEHAESHLSMEKEADREYCDLTLRLNQKELEDILLKISIKQNKDIR